MFGMTKQQQLQAYVGTANNFTQIFKDRFNTVMCQICPIIIITTLYVECD